MKRIVSLLLCAILLSTQVMTGAFAAPSSQDAQMVIRALGIMNGDGSGNLNLDKNVSRAEFAKMLIAASSYKDAAQSGAPASSFSDVPSTHWAASYIRLAAQNGWMTGYSDGTFRPNGIITYEEGASAVLKLLGFDATDLTGNYPSAQIAKFTSLSLNDGLTISQGQTLTRMQCMYIFYNLMSAKNKEGIVYGTSLGYTIADNGQIDYAKIVQSDMKGPYVIDGQSASSIVPFSLESATIYRNGISSVASAIIQYDIIYYNENVQSVWVYSDRVVGTYSAASPSTASPDTVTVAGNTYTVSGASARHKLSSAGEYVPGDVVSLLLGMDGSVVDVISGDVAATVYYGMVNKLSFQTIGQSASSSVTQHTLSVICTDGITRDVAVSSTKYEEGSFVIITYDKGDLTVDSLPSKTLSGKINNEGTTLGQLSFASDVSIMDVSETDEYVFLYPSRLAGYTLQAKDVRFYALNANNEISHMILSDATGDQYTYGIMTSVSETTSDGLSGTYKYMISGTEYSISTSGMIYTASEGPSIFYKDSDGGISSIRSLRDVALTELSALSASANSKTYRVSDDVQVYIYSSYKHYNKYYAASLSAINTTDYTLTGYYTDKYSAGDTIRVIIAKEK